MGHDFAIYNLIPYAYIPNVTLTNPNSSLTLTLTLTLTQPIGP